MKKRKAVRKQKVVKSPAPTLYDVNVCAPDFFSLNLGAYSSTEAEEWVGQAVAFIDTMIALHRATMLCYDSESKELYLASVDERGIGHAL